MRNRFGLRRPSPWWNLRGAAPGSGDGVLILLPYDQPSEWRSMEPNMVSRRWPLMLLLLMLPLYAVGLFVRGFWTPDEPRDSAIAARMADPGSDWAVPHLGHDAFCEKPPLWF